MHRPALAALCAALALGGCRKSNPPPAGPTAPSAPGSAAASVAPAAPVAVVDAGLPGAAATPLALGLAHPHTGSVDHLGRARTLADSGDAVEALAEARRQLADTPEDEEALGMVARGARALGQRALAAAAFEKLGRVREDDAVPLLQAARLRLELGDTDAAVRLASLALARDEGNVDGHQLLGRAALVRGELRVAIDWLEQARELAPAHGWVLNNLGFAYLRANENGRALEVLLRAAELLPGAAVVQNNLGVALERAGRTDEAAAAFERSATLAPRYTRAQVNRARLAALRTVDAGSPPDPDAEEDGGSE